MTYICIGLIEHTSGNKKQFRCMKQPENIDKYFFIGWIWRQHRLGWRGDWHRGCWWRHDRHKYGRWGRELCII